MAQMLEDKNLELIVEPLDVQGVCPATAAPGTEVLIHWKDLPAFEDSWESADVITTQFPSLNLEDKVLFGRRVMLDLLSNSLTPVVRAEVEEKCQVALVGYLVLEKPF